MPHTPGPWTNDEGLVCGKESRVGMGEVSIDIFNAHEWPASLFDEAMTNAMLIAAAPEMYALIEELGDAITDMFEQLTRGDWRDGHGHDVRLNKQMASLVPLVRKAIILRAPFVAKARAPK